MLISDKIDFKIHCYVRQRRTLHNDQGFIHEEGIAIVNIYVLHTGTPQYIRQMLTAIKGEMYSNTIIVGDFNTPFTSIDHPDRKSIRKHRSFNVP